MFPSVFGSNTDLGKLADEYLNPQFLDSLSEKINIENALSNLNDLVEDFQDIELPESLEKEELKTFVTENSGTIIESLNDFLDNPLSDQDVQNLVDATNEAAENESKAPIIELINEELGLELPTEGGKETLKKYISENFQDITASLNQLLDEPLTDEQLETVNNALDSAINDNDPEPLKELLAEHFEGKLPEDLDLDELREILEEHRDDLKKLLEELKSDKTDNDSDDEAASALTSDSAELLDGVPDELINLTEDPVTLVDDADDADVEIQIADAEGSDDIVRDEDLPIDDSEINDADFVPFSSEATAANSVDPVDDYNMEIRFLDADFG